MVFIIDENCVRFDKWFWVVCFYKICILVKEVIEGGKVYYNS